MKRTRIERLLKVACQRNPAINKCTKNYQKLTKAQLQAILEHQMVLETLEPEITRIGGSLFQKLKQGWNSAKEFFGVNTKNFNKTSQRTINELGNKQITQLKVARTPLSKSINRLLNVLSLGATKRAKQKLTYHSFYHLALVAKLNGVAKPVVIEKNEAVNVDRSFPVNNLTQFMDVPVSSKITLSEILQKTIQTVGQKRVFLYRAFNDTSDGGNCQRFVSDVLKSNGLITPQLDTFINQNVEQASRTIPQLFRKVANVATDAGAFISKAIGRGKNDFVKNIVDGIGGFLFDGVVGSPIRKTFGEKALKLVSAKSHNRIIGQEEREGKLGKQRQRSRRAKDLRYGY